MTNIANILKKVKAELSAGLPFMEGREQGSIVTGHEFTIVEFGFLKDKEENDREYACFLLKEDEKHFYFGGSVITDNLKKIQGVLSSEELAELMTQGLKVKFTKVLSQDKKREYMSMELV